jgi:hypothetical protein|tara:strand:- start:7022 stop:7198 length:177 start_codon:yes stop_codon:yes gene_type:complete
LKARTFVEKLRGEKVENLFINKALKKVAINNPGFKKKTRVCRECAKEAGINWQTKLSL